MLYLLHLLFLASGFAGLALEVVWLRQLGLVFGNTARAVALVLAAFMGGLGLGSFVLGWAGDRARNALRAYGVLELAIAVAAAATTLLLDARAAGPGGGARSPAAQIALVLGALAAPAALMGATLPVMSRAAVTRIGEAGARIGLLYATNTLGAAAGALATGFILLSHLGVRETGLAAAGLDAAVGVAALLLSRNARSSARAGAAPARLGPRAIAGSAGLGSAAILLLAAQSGLVTLGYEVLWTRLLVYSIANTVYSFAAMLAVFLFGLVGGGAIAALRLRSGADPARDLAWAQVGAGALGLLGLAFLQRLLPAQTDRFALADWPALLAATLVPAAWLVLPPTLFLGQAFPLLNALRARRLERLGADVGGVYAANTLGSIAGALGVGLALLPALGAARAGAVLVAVNLATGGALFALAAQRAAGVGLVAAAVAVATVAPGREAVRAVLLRDSAGGRDPAALLTLEEGATTTVAIVDDRAGWRDLRAKRLVTDGVNMSGTNRQAERYMKFLAHLPLLLHPAPRSVLVVGLGTGMTAGASCLHPLVEEVTTIELASEVARGARLFADVNHGVLDQPKHHLVIDDARHFLRHTTETYDVILAEPPPPRSSATVNLYSRDYYDACRRVLRPGGLVLQWMPLHSQGDQELRTKLRTFQAVFPEASLWLPMGEEAIALGAAGEPAESRPAPPPPPDRSELRRRMTDPALAPALADLGLAAPEDLLACYWLGPGALARATRDLPVITDRRPNTQHYLDHPRLLDPFDCLRLLTLREPPPPRLAALADSPETLAAAAAAQDELVRGQALHHPAQILEALLASPSNLYYQRMNVAAPDQEAALLDEIRRRPEDAELRLARARQLAARGRYEESLAELGRLARAAPGWPLPGLVAARVCLRAGDPARGLAVLAGAARGAGGPDQASAALGHLLELDATIDARPQDIEVSVNLVDLALAAGELGLARREAARITAQVPGNPAAIAALARALDESGYPERALPLCERLAAARPGDPAPARARARALFYAGRAADAEPLLAAAAERDPRDWEAHRLRAEALRELGRYREARAAIAPLARAPDRATRLLAAERARAYRRMERKARASRS